MHGVLSAGGAALATIEPEPAFTPEDAADWTRRGQYWAAVEPKPEGKRGHSAIIITGHNMLLRVHRGGLEIVGGFTHHPQPRESHRLFPGDRLPARVVMLDGSGSITLDAMDWLARRGIPLLRLDYRGAIVSCLGAAPETWGIDPLLAAAQREAAGNYTRAMAIATWLIREKLIRCRAVAEELMPETPERARALDRLAEDAAMLGNEWRGAANDLLGIEGINARAYFQAWGELPLTWKSTARHPIPERWRTVGTRSTRGPMSNRFARHPAQALLNYAYTVLESEVRLSVIGAGFDPAIGFLHRPRTKPPTADIRPADGSPMPPERSALVLDLMEPMRPDVDRQVIHFLRRHKFEPADFVVHPDGECRLHPQLARTLVAEIEECGLGGRISPVLDQLGRLLADGLRLRSAGEKPRRPRKVPDAAAQQRIREAQRRAFADPSFRAKVSVATREALAKPDVRAKMREARLGAKVSPETRERMAKAKRKDWADPAKRTKMLQARRKEFSGA